MELLSFLFCTSGGGSFVSDVLARVPGLAVWLLGFRICDGLEGVWGIRALGV